MYQSFMWLEFCVSTTSEQPDPVTRMQYGASSFIAVSDISLYIFVWIFLKGIMNIEIVCVPSVHSTGGNIFSMTSNIPYSTMWRHIYRYIWLKYYQMFTQIFSVCILWKLINVRHKQIHTFVILFMYMNHFAIIRWIFVRTWLHVPSRTHWSTSSDTHLVVEVIPETCTKMYTPF